MGGEIYHEDVAAENDGAREDFLGVVSAEYAEGESWGLDLHRARSFGNAPGSGQFEAEYEIRPTVRGAGFRP